MPGFYRKALIALVALLLADLLAGALCVHQSYLTAAVRPSGGWRAVAITDAPEGGASTAQLLGAARESLRFAFTVRDAVAYPWAAAGLLRVDHQERLETADLSRYDHVTFLARCAPANALIFDMSVFDESVSTVGDLLTYPTPMTYFACNERGVPVTLDLTRLSIPQWWLLSLKRGLTDQSYKLDRVARFEFAASPQSPHNRASQVEISELTLHGRDYRYLAGLAAMLVAGWAGFGVWFLVAHARALRVSLEAKLRKDLPFVAYRELTLEPCKDTEKTTVLRFIASQYTDAALDLERVVAGTGVNRNKINDVLKAELGMTFISYLNKLRLTEAARLLTENSSSAVAEVAYSVGYGNVSYFNKLFKEEYGCAPRTFRKLKQTTAQLSNSAQCKKSSRSR
ncbi:helix-turn-helix domain-containing protein [Duganella sp.]|uniref:helix-turn-helix domain-containing protein n=1 Tax=Duganella sp. TaxID=1904440 RepID=UPI0031DDE158